MAAARSQIDVASAHTPTAAVEQHSPWHSPVPYLFGGLAAMLGLIAFALLILACSYWKLSGYLENGGGNDGGERDLEAGGDQGGNNKTGDGDKQGVQSSFAQTILVFMAGEKKPTFLATPMSSRSSSFGDTSSTSSSSSSEQSCSCREKDGKLENGALAVEMMKQQNTDNYQRQGEQNGSMGSNESSIQNH